MDTKIHIESKGKPDAVSPTGPVGILQYTKATARRFGLMGKGFDYRRDPVKSIEAQAQADAVYAATLKRNGIPPTPLNVYLAHQQGEGGIIAIIKAAQSGREVPPDIRVNMNHNGGKGKTPAQFLAMWQNKWNAAEREVQNLYRQNGPVHQAQQAPFNELTPLPPEGKVAPALLNAQRAQDVMDTIPSSMTLNAAAQHGASMYEDPTAEKQGPDPFSSGINWMAQLDSVFNLSRPSVVPAEVHNAIKGVFESV